jgi:hypothetical protein
MADEQKPREITKEEQAVLDEGKAQLERAKMAIGQPLPAMHDPLWLLSEEGAPVLAHALGRNAKNQSIQPKTGTVTVKIPKEFVYHATNFHRFVMKEGVREIPESLLDVPYIVSKGVMVWDRPKPQVQVVTILGSTTLGPTVKYLGHDVPSENFITAAFEASKLSVDQWNLLSDEERGTRAIDEVSRAEAAQAVSKDQSEGRAPMPPKPVMAPQPLMGQGAPAPQRPQMTPPEVKKAEAAMQPDKFKK